MPDSERKTGSVAAVRASACALDDVAAAGVGRDDVSGRIVGTVIDNQVGLKIGRKGPVAIFPGVSLALHRLGRSAALLRRTPVPQMVMPSSLPEVPEESGGANSSPTSGAGVGVNAGAGSTAADGVAVAFTGRVAVAVGTADAFIGTVSVPVGTAVGRSRGVELPQAASATMPRHKPGQQPPEGQRVSSCEFSCLALYYILLRCCCVVAGDAKPRAATCTAESAPHNAAASSTAPIARFASSTWPPGTTGLREERLWSGKQERQREREVGLDVPTP